MAELIIQNVSKRYRQRGGDVQALADISLTVPTGIFGLLGPNGAGKSTLMTILATLQEPDDGSIRLGSVDARAEPQKMRAELGYLPQEFGVYPGVSAEVLLDYLARLKGLSDRKARHEQVGQLLELVNLERDKDRAVDTYSGGMRQRFGVAQALLGRPALLIVDEPTAGLDPAERNRFHRILAEIGRHTAVLLSTHIVEDVANLCQGLAILHKGRLQTVGAPADLLSELQGTLWQASFDPDEAERVAGTHRVISTRMRAGQILTVIRSVASPGAPFVPKTPDLEDVYFLTIPQGEGD